MKQTTLPLAFLLSILSLCGSVQGYKRLLDGPHMTHTRHRQLCIPDTTGIKECDGLNEGEWKMWDEFSCFQSDTEYGAAVMPNQGDKLYLKYLGALSKTTSEGSEDMWKPKGTTTEENGKVYNKFTMRPRDIGLGNEKNVLLDSGTLPDELVYLETPEGEPYAMRQYSKQNRGTMYFETMFMMTQELTEEEMQLDPRQMAMEMAMSITGAEAQDHVEEDPIPEPRTLRGSEYVSQATMASYYHRNENWEFANEFNRNGQYPQAAVSSIVVAQKKNDDGSAGDIIGLQTFVDRADQPTSQRGIGNGSAILSEPIDLGVDEWITQLDGHWYNGVTKQIVFTTNKGQSHEIVSSDFVPLLSSSDSSSTMKFFSLKANQSEAFYGIRAYVEQPNSRIKDFKALWGPAPDQASRKLSIDMGSTFSAKKTAVSRTKAASRGLLRKGARRQQFELESEITRFKIELPPQCVDNEKKKGGLDACLSIFQTQIEDAVSTNVYIRVRDGNNNSAESEGILTTENGDIKSLRLTGRGCAVPASIGVGRLGRIFPTVCAFGDLAFKSDRTIVGQKGNSISLTTEVAGQEVDITLSGQYGVKAVRDGDSVRFGGVNAEASLKLDVAGAVTVGATGFIDHAPQDVINQDDWVTEIRVRPELSISLFLYKWTASYTFQIAKIGPGGRKETEELSAPNVPPYPDISDLRISEFASGEKRSKLSDGFIDFVNNGVRPDTPVKTVVVVQFGRSLGPFFEHFGGTARGNEIFSVQTRTQNDFIRQLGRDQLRLLDDKKRSSFTLPRDEWIVRVSGAILLKATITQIKFETNKGRVFNFSQNPVVHLIPSAESFELTGKDGEALYGLTGFVDIGEFTATRRTERIIDLKAVWGAAPKLECKLPAEDSDLCIPVVYDS